MSKVVFAGITVAEIMTGVGFLSSAAGALQQGQQSKLQADHIHLFESSLINIGPVSHLRLNMFPDGGISRLRAYGKVDGN